MKSLVARLERVESFLPRTTGPSRQDRILALVVEDPAALAMAEQLRRLRAAGRHLTPAEMLALPGMGEVHDRLKARYVEKYGEMAS